MMNCFIRAEYYVIYCHKNPQKKSHLKNKSLIIKEGGFLLSICSWESCVAPEIPWNLIRLKKVSCLRPLESLFKPDGQIGVVYIKADFLPDGAVDVVVATPVDDISQFSGAEAENL